MKKVVFALMALFLLAPGLSVAKTANAHEALEEAVKEELGKRIEFDRVAPADADSSVQDSVSNATGTTAPNPAEILMESIDRKARESAEKAAAKVDERLRKEQAAIEAVQGKPRSAEEAEDSAGLEKVVDTPYDPSGDVATGKEGANPDLSQTPEVKIPERESMAIAPNDAASNPKGKTIDYYVFTTALDRQKWRAKRLDPNIRAFIDENVAVHVIPSARPASSLAYVFNHLWDTGHRKEALALLDYCYEYGRSVIPMKEISDWLVANGLEPADRMRIDPEILKKRLSRMNAMIRDMSALDLSWSPSRAANWHDGVVFVDGKFDPELFMRVYGEANPEKAKNFLVPREVDPADIGDPGK